MNIITKTLYFLEFMIAALRVLDRAEVRAYYRRSWFETHARHEWRETHQGRLKLVEKSYTASQHVEMEPGTDEPFDWSSRPAGYACQHPENDTVTNTLLDIIFWGDNPGENPSAFVGTKYGRAAFVSGAPFRRGAI